MLAVALLSFEEVSAQTPLVSGMLTNSKGSLVPGLSIKAKSRL